MSNIKAIKTDANSELSDAKVFFEECKKDNYTSAVTIGYNEDGALTFAATSNWAIKDIIFAIEAFKISAIIDG